MLGRAKGQWEVSHDRDRRRVEYMRTFRAVKRTGISLTQLKRYARDGLLTIYKPSPKVAW